MPDAKTGFDIRVNSIPRTFRDRKDMAYDAARLLKSKNPKAIIEVVDCSTDGVLLRIRKVRFTLNSDTKADTPECQLGAISDRMASQRNLAPSHSRGVG